MRANILIYRVFSNKWTPIILGVLFSLFIQWSIASANYYPLECSDHYSGYCSENNDCFTQFGDNGVNYLDFCFDVPNNPHEFSDELTGIEVLSDQMDMLISGNIFLYNIIGFWIPFSTILFFSMAVVFFLLLKFGYFRRK